MWFSIKKTGENTNGRDGSQTSFVEHFLQTKFQGEGSPRYEKKGEGDDEGGVDELESSA